MYVTMCGNIFTWFKPVYYVGNHHTSKIHPAHIPVSTYCTCSICLYIQLFRINLVHFLISYLLSLAHLLNMARYVPSLLFLLLPRFMSSTYSAYTPASSCIFLACSVLQVCRN